MNLKTGGYDTEYSHNSSSTQNIIEVPLGVKLGGSFNLSDGYILNTELDVHAVKVLKGRDSKSTVTFNGYSMSDSTLRSQNPILHVNNIFDSTTHHSLII